MDKEIKVALIAIMYALIFITISLFLGEKYAFTFLGFSILVQLLLMNEKRRWTNERNQV